MAWTVEVSDVAEKQLRTLDRPVQKRLIDWLDEPINGCKNPRHFGAALPGEMAGLWRYRVGDYRIICERQEQQLVVLALAIGLRRAVDLHGK